ncbi:MAG: diguanylate cyclase [Roseofilum sp. SBFL]|uniref:diguanylate cyclase domain-containing protein n=2 Tax=Roseofilum TaxID=1233426 RepID=UPI001B26A630|nr:MULTISPECIES: diguanylate cyclase [unclassified Roseofilum]MBP0012827.1 diguanylate cyclase [Roseofilum sp. SID3]MBP0042443.1 diguanylate cyclase [Roseofilum sp. SBFL]
MADRFFHPPKTVPLSIYILVPVVLPILVAMTLTGWLSLRQNHQLVQQLSLQWMQEVADSLETRLTLNLDFPQELLNSYPTLPLDDESALSNQNCFWPFLNSFPHLQGIYLGLHDSGDLLAIHRTENGETICTQANRETEQRLLSYRLNDRGEIQEQIQAASTPYDVRQEFWYKNSLIEENPTITIIPSSSHAKNSVHLQLKQPLYNTEQELVAVSRIDFNLDLFLDYIQEKSRNFSANILVFDPQLNLLNHSALTSEKQNALDSDLVPEIQNHLQNPSSDRLQIINHNKQNYWILSSPYHWPGEQQWWIAIIVPEQQIFKTVQINFRNHLLINLSALLIAITWGGFCLYKVSYVLNQLSKNVEEALYGNLHFKSWNKSIVDPLDRLINRAQRLSDYGSQIMESIQEENKRLLDKVDSGTNLLIEAVEKADQANLKLQQSQSRVESIINSSMDGIMAFQSIRDRRGSIVDFEWIVCNQVSAHFFHIKTVNLVGKSWLQEIKNPNLRSLFDHYVSVVETGRNVELEFPYDYQTERAWFHAIAVKLGDGLSVNFRDITDRKKSVFELRKMLDEVHKLANTDGLTKVANRRQFDECLYQEWLRLKRDGLPLSIILCDVDYFKLYNDTYGHQAGDDCLIQVARVIQHSVRRASDVVARYGGEEFVVLLPNTSEDGAKVVAQLIQSKMEDLQIPHESSKVASTVTISLGIATLVPTTQLSKESLIALADEALYEAKEQGRNQFVVKS